jgi:hypothetical protein
MTSSSPKLSKAMNRIQETDIDSLLTDPSDSASKSFVTVVFLATDPFDLGPTETHQAVPFTCSSVHEFLRQGLQNHPFVVITEINRHECSAIQLGQILSKRSSCPFRIIYKTKENPHEILEEANHAIGQVLASCELENKIIQKTKDIFKEAQYNELFTSRDFKQAKEVLRARVRQKIESEPEKFLEDAISRIRTF